MKAIKIELFNPSLSIKVRIFFRSKFSFNLSVFSVFAMLLLVLRVEGQTISLTTDGNAYTQDFNTLANTGTNNTIMPGGWYFVETGSSGNTTYAASTGSDNVGNTYSFGSTPATDRSLGTLLSGNVTATIGAKFTNNLGFTISSITINYTGEQWRLGALGRVDQLDFQYSLDATSLSLGTWTDVNLLDFVAPITTGTVGALNGNNSSNRVSITNTISNLSIGNGQSIWIRWTDLNSSGADDGLGIDDFSIVAMPNTLPSGLSTFTNLTIPAGTTLTVPNGSQLTVTGTLTNNGTLTIESGATLVQGATSTLAGTGTYNVKQAVTGGNDGTNPNSRFWYIGSPVSSSSSSALFLGANDVVKKRDEPNNTWTALSSGTPENLMVGRGYYMRTTQSTPTINFTGGVINNNPTASALTLNLTRTAGQGFEGFNLVCNPYPSYLDWDLVTKDQVENTIWYRTADNTNTMVFETYVSGAANGIGTSISGNTATKLIPPMQSFWVRVASTYTSGSITLNNSMRSHFASYGSSTAGLRSTVNDFNLFLRMNLVQEDKKDQIIVYVNENSSNQYDAFDGEKMMQVDRPQFYTTASGKKIVINGLSAEDTQQSLPLTMELTTTGTHQFMVEDLEIAVGNVWLEDKLKETYQLLEPGFGYKFFAYAGLTNDRFVLHLKLKDANSPSTPNFDAANEMAANHANVYTEGAGVVVIKLPTSDEVATDVQIYDAAGRPFFSGTLKSLETKIQLEQAKGIYYVSLTSVNGVEVRKVFIQ